MTTIPFFLLHDIVTTIILTTLKQRQKNSKKHYTPTFDTTTKNMKMKVIGSNSTVIYLKVNLRNLRKTY